MDTNKPLIKIDLEKLRSQDSEREAMISRYKLNILLTTAVITKACETSKFDKKN